MNTYRVAYQIVNALYIIVVFFYNNVLAGLTVRLWKLHRICTVLCNSDRCQCQICLSVFQIHGKRIKGYINDLQIHAKTVCNIFCNIKVNSDYVLALHVFKRRPCSISCHYQLSFFKYTLQSGLVICQACKSCAQTNYHCQCHTDCGCFFHNVFLLVFLCMSFPDTSHAFMNIYA